MMALIETMTSSSMQIIDTRGSREIFTVKKFKECADTWSDTNNCPLDMLDIPRRGEVYKFIFGQFVFQNDEIDDAIENYDDKATFGIKNIWEEYNPRH